MEEREKNRAEEDKQKEAPGTKKQRGKKANPEDAPEAAKNASGKKPGKDKGGERKKKPSTPNPTNVPKPPKTKKPPKPPKTTKQVVKEAAATARKALPAIVRVLVKEAKEGSLPHAKMVLQETGMDKMLVRETQREVDEEEQSLTNTLLEELSKKSER